MKPGRTESDDVGEWPLMRRLLLNELGDSQNEQARALRVSQAAVGNWRSTRSTAPRSILERLALCSLASLPEETRRKALLEGLERLRGLEA